MFLAHSFRLRDPWQCECGNDGALCWTRAFHRPTGLEHDDALWLVIAGLPSEAAVIVNGQPIPRVTPEGRNEFEVTHLLAETNKIEIQVPADSPYPQSTPFPYDVRLGVVGHS